MFKLLNRLCDKFWGIFGYIDTQNLKVIRRVNDIVESEKFILDQIKGNTMLVPNGQELVKQMEGVCDVLKQVRDSVVSQQLIRMGYPQGSPVSIDIGTGKVLRL